MSLTGYKTGHVYALPVELATLMIVEGWAEPVVDVDAAPDLPPFRLQTLVFPRRTRRRRYSSPLLDTRLGIAAERRSRKR